MYRSIAVAMLLLVALSTVVPAAIIRVPADAPTLRDGIELAAEGDTVSVAPGTYEGEGNRALSFPARNLVLISEAGPTATTIDCGGVARAIEFAEPAIGPSTIISGFTVTGGSATYGGAISIAGCSPVIENCVFECNLASSRGGAITCTSSLTARIRDCHFTGNSAPAGGAIHSRGFAMPWITRCSFIGNSASQQGGAMCVRLLNGLGPTTSECVFQDNTASRGGAVYVDTAVSAARTGGSSDLHARSRRYSSYEDCEFSGNTASALGGAVYIIDVVGEGLQIVMQSSRFLGNEAEEGGGVFTAGGECTLLWWCLFVGNVASTGGGAVFTSSAGAQQCTFYGNTASIGAALDLARSDSWCPDGHSVAACVISANTGGPAVNCGLGHIECLACVSYGNPGGDELCPGDWGNLYTDPLLCDPANGDFTLCADSPCLPDANPWGYQLGAFGAGCGPCATAIEERSWGRVKSLFR